MQDEIENFTASSRPDPPPTRHEDLPKGDEGVLSLELNDLEEASGHYQKRQSTVHFSRSSEVIRYGNESLSSPRSSVRSCKWQQFHSKDPRDLVRFF